MTPLGNDNYAVDRMANGTFEAFAQPNSQQLVHHLAARRGEGPDPRHELLRGAPRPPARSPRTLPSEEPTATGSHAQLMQLFPDIADSDISGGGTWVFAYHTAHGSMTQRYDTRPATWGNITG